MRRNSSLKTIQITCSFINSGNFTTMQMRNLHGDVYFRKKLFAAHSLRNIPTSPYINLMKVFIYVIATHCTGI